jgi:hypothetical protein
MRILVVALAMLLCSSASAGDPGKLNSTNYAKIVPGASITYVRGCLGKETDFTVSKTANKKSLTWKEGKTTIRVSFEKDQVVSKSEHGVTSGSKK